MNSLLRIAVAPVVLLVVACGGSTTATTPSPTVAAISMSPAACFVGKSGGTAHLSATATMSDGSKKEITQIGKWSTEDVSKATVNEKGLLIGVNPGETKVSVSYEGATGTMDCKVIP